ncbi:MAG: M23 family metallopeptidase [Saprospiraceae bacterium]|nr:M23 family metallopeptidase [Saprospiraceae bacterium]MCF8250774.1 M23 family metallopeptidase [Saprospiraceae bacterium]MCF8282186.1 M23 family metallopeptidase [Bacteroidales bacterium]MCF8312575.1 M23 family metallopeptidase [Saprospiraceae bacterium]MCF8440904.1 M23 family metallopeptidase [Saprospiraceae bacterium]
MKKTTFFRLVSTIACLLGIYVFSFTQVTNYVYLKPTKVSGIENFTTWRFTGISFARSPLSYPYDFVNPVASSLLCDPVLQTGTACNKTPVDVPVERYLISGFGPRMTVSSTSGITRKFDYHLGADMIDRTQNITDNNLPDIKCMCAGEVVEIDNDNDSNGRSVKVKCNSTFEGMGTTNWGNIYMAFRHLSSIDASMALGKIVKKGDIIGIMGNTGTGSGNNHFHLSLQRKESGSYYNVHPMRAYNPAKNPHLIEALDKSAIEIYFLNINTWQSDGYVIFRFAVPHYQANLQMISLRSGSTTRTFDMEQRSYDCHTDTDCLDDNSFDNMELFVFPFTRLKSAFQLYDQYKDLMDANHTGKKYPIKDAGVFKKSAYVIDIKTTLGSRANLKTNGIEIYVSDIWGQGVRAMLSANGI